MQQVLFECTRQPKGKSTIKTNENNQISALRESFNLQPPEKEGITFEGGVPLSGWVERSCRLKWRSSSISGVLFTVRERWSVRLTRVVGYSVRSYVVGVPDRETVTAVVKKELSRKAVNLRSHPPHLWS
ncbi:hypothetical protein L3Q82_017512 [Scortum barcoo]|uniref:Uncharacterized protein n=1 Tax=Scortum barcoo TaxID=214431 RepID=A0ACB8VKW5_9TELE|nr:hypothetical protein L3Q82_017512 [Scortum barcoo]